MYRPDLTCVNAISYGSRILTGKIRPSPSAGVSSIGVVRPQTDAPHGVNRAVFSHTLIFSAQNVFFVGLCVNLANVPDRTTAFCVRALNSVVEATPTGTDVLVGLGVRRTQN